MGAVRRAVGLAFPVSRAGVALWAWQYRREIGGWAGYVARSAPRVVAGDTDDVLAEGRLRARLTADSRTRNVDGLRVEVTDGVAHLHGLVAPAVHDAVLEIATNTTGVTRVRDDLTEPRRRARR
jgi:hypothetical protein